MIKTIDKDGIVWISPNIREVEEMCPDCEVHLVFNMKRPERGVFCLNHLVK